MRTLLLTLIALTALLALIPIQTRLDISGAWQLERTLPNGRSVTFYYVFKADGDTFTGRMAGPQGRLDIVNGVVNGTHVTFEVKPWDPAGRSRTVNGDLNGEDLVLAASFGRQGQPITLHRVTTSTEFNPPPALARLHQPFPPFEPIPANGMARTPPMGWNSWNKFNRRVDDKIVREIADAIVSSGMRDAGYTYINIDDTWEGTRDEKGNIRTNEKFPDMKALAAYVHSKGLKLGIYSSPGRTTCAGYEGSYAHEAQDARTYAEWGIDYLKYDWCSATAMYDAPEMPSAYQKMAIALRNSGRKIVYSLCQYGMLDVGAWGAAAGGNLWRTTGDISDNWRSMSNLGFNLQSGREKVAGPGHWNDPDMLEIGNGGMSAAEYRTHMSLWSLLAAPLLAGNDLRSMSDSDKEILTNREVIAVDQDRLGKQGVRVKQDGDTQIWQKPLTKGNAIGLFNMGADSAKMTVRWADLGISRHRKVRDLWAHTDLTAPDEVTVAVPSHGCVMLRVQ